MTVLWYAAVDGLQGTSEDRSIGWLEKKQKSLQMNPMFLERLPAEVLARGEEMTSMILQPLPTQLCPGSHKKRRQLLEKIQLPFK